MPSRGVHEHKFDSFDQPDPRAPRLFVCRCGAAYPEPRPKSLRHDRAAPFRRRAVRPSYERPSEARLVGCLLLLVGLAALGLWLVVVWLFPHVLPDPYAAFPLFPMRPQVGFLPTPAPP